jgi:hypothetical protein
MNVDVTWVTGSWIRVRPSEDLWMRARFRYAVVTSDSEEDIHHCRQSDLDCGRATSDLAHQFHRDLSPLFLECAFAPPLSPATLGHLL